MAGFRYLALYAEGYTASAAYGGTAFVILEIQAFTTDDDSGTNHALNKNCYASLEYTAANRAVDGDTGTSWIAHHLTDEPYQWWAVDLGAGYDIKYLNWYVHSSWAPSQVGVFATNSYNSPPTVANGWQRVGTLTPVMTTGWQGFSISPPAPTATVPMIDGWGQTGALIR